MKVALFDVCHTLYRANTTYDFLSYYLAEDPRLQKLMARRQSLLGRIQARLGDSEQVQRLAAIKLLKGVSEAQLKSAAANFTASLSEIEPTMKLLNAAKAEGSEVVLVSSSLDVVVAAIAEKLGIKRFYASKLAFDAGLCRGELTTDLLGNKAGLIEQTFRADHTVLYTDNFSDADCMDVVDKLYPVYRRGDVRAQEFWRRRTSEPPVCYD